jgi:transposase
MDGHPARHDGSGPAREIAVRAGVGKGTVHNLISDYNRFGPEVMERTGRGGRRNAHLTLEEEAEFIAPFAAMAEKGQIVRGAQMGRVLEERLGYRLHHSIIYRLLDHHEWRKVVPRPFDPNSRQEIQEEFKKKLPEKIAEVWADRDPQDTRPAAHVPQNEGRFGRISEPRRCWAPKGMRPRVPRQIVREYLDV